MLVSYNLSSVVFFKSIVIEALIVSLLPYDSLIVEALRVLSIKIT